MKKLMAIVVTLVLLLTLGSGLVLAAPQGMGDDETDWQVTKGKAVFTKLEDKPGAPIDWSPAVSNGIWGWIVTPEKMDGNLDGEIEVKGLSPNTWYMVTLQGPSGTIPTGSDVGLFGGTDTGSWSWTDLALFKTDDDGNGISVLPSNGGLSGTGGGTPGVNGYVPGIAASPSLPPGTYSGVLVAVKDVGSSADGTTPDINTLMWGGTAVLFEMMPLDFTIK